MIVRDFRQGEILYREGDRSENIYLVVEGSVEILKTISGETEVVGTAKAGDFIGEISALIDRKRSTSARVGVDGARIRLLEKDKFLRLTSIEPDTAYGLMRRLCERLHSSSRRASDDAVIQVIRTAKGHSDAAATETAPPKAKAGSYLTIFPETDLLSEQMPKEGISLMSSPFIIGRKQDAEQEQAKAAGNWLKRGNDRRSQGERRDESNLPKVHLQLTDSQPYRLSRIHFLIQKMPDGGYIVRDLGSTLGTQVNDNFLGTDFPKDFVELDSGDNTITAGGGDSPYRFRVAIETE